MIDLELLGVGADGESLVFTDSDGERYRVQITDELRGVTRRDRPKLESAPAPTEQTLRPREIQSLLRAGATPEDIARSHSVDITQVLRYETPIIAEKEYAVQRARATRIGADGPTMGDLVIDRLAARGVDPASLTWSAQRETQGPWQICLTFVQGAAEHGAHWTLLSSGVLEAIDQEARWLTETVSQAPTASIFTPMPVPEPEAPDASDVQARESIIDQLNAARGKRQEIEYDLDEDEAAEFAEAIEDEAAPESAAPSISARIYSLAQARTKNGPAPAPEEGRTPIPSPFPAPTAEPAESDESPAARPPASDEPEALPGLDLSAASTASSPAPKKSKSRRRSVPSWDEIVFGSKPQ